MQESEYLCKKIHKDGKNMLLDAWLRKNNISTYTFADEIGVSVNTIYNIISGENTRVSIAVKIEDATNGEVTCRDLVPKNQKEEKDHGNNRKTYSKKTNSYV